MWFAVMAKRFTNRELMWSQLPKTQFTRETFKQLRMLSLLIWHISLRISWRYVCCTSSARVYKQCELPGSALNNLACLQMNPKCTNKRNTYSIRLRMWCNENGCTMRSNKLNERIQFYSLLWKQITKRHHFSLTKKVRFAALACKAMSKRMVTL